MILNEATHQKKIIFHPQMMPGIVISDPELTVGCRARSRRPPVLTRSFIVSKHSALRASIRWPMASRWRACDWSSFPAACLCDGSDIEARAQMLAAASMGATAFQKGLGAVHAIAHPVGSLFNTHHGLTNAIIMPYVMVFNRSAIADKADLIARVLDLPARGLDALLGCVLQMRRDLGIPNALSEIGVSVDKAEIIAREAALDPSAGGNPIPVSATMLERIFRAAVEGDLRAVPSPV